MNHGFGYDDHDYEGEGGNIIDTQTKVIRKINKMPFKVLDAPQLEDDYYLNLVDWSSENVLAVGLRRAVYLERSHFSSQKAL